jgi:hypothetical protein
MGLSEFVQRVLGVSVYEAGPMNFGALDLDDDQVTRARKMTGGNLQPLPTTRLRWYAADLESAQQAADLGDLQMAAQLYRAMRRDGMFAGLLSTRTSGLVGLPRRFRGDAKAVEALQATNDTRAAFDEMCPPAELALLAADGVTLGIGLAEIVPVVGRAYGVLERKDPEFLRYKWSTGRWYYRSIGGEIEIKPGDGRWVLHVAGGRLTPWQSGVWAACARAFISKDHALAFRDNFVSKLANPARVAISPAGATEPQREGFLAKLIGWGVNTSFELPPGYDVKLVETQGRGYQIFAAAKTDSDLEIMVALAGQIVTTTGGTGFANADIHKSIRADLIKADGSALAHTLNTQVLPYFVLSQEGFDVEGSEFARIEWDTDPPTDRAAEGQAMLTAADLIKRLDDVLGPHDLQANAREIVERFGLPVEAAPKRDLDAGVRLDIAPTDLAKCVTVDEVRASRKLGPIGDERGSMTVLELEETQKAAAAGEVVAAENAAAAVVPEPGATELGDPQ